MICPHCHQEIDEIPPLSSAVLVTVKGEPVHITEAPDRIGGYSRNGHYLPLVLIMFVENFDLTQKTKSDV